MAIYFTDFPKIQYGFLPDNKTVRTTNILRRFAPLKVVLERCDIYYPYDILDGERPEIVSDKFYGKVDYDWLILMFNERLDPYYYWPMDNTQFNEFIIKKYGSLSAATHAVHHYEKIIQAKETIYDGTQIAERTLVVDVDTYYDLAEEDRKVVYYFDYEVAKNEAYRTIQVPDARYIPQIIHEKEKILKS